MTERPTQRPLPLEGDEKAIAIFSKQPKAISPKTNHSPSLMKDSKESQRKEFTTDSLPEMETALIKYLKEHLPKNLSNFSPAEIALQWKNDKIYVFLTHDAMDLLSSHKKEFTTFFQDKLFNNKKIKRAPLRKTAEKDEIFFDYGTMPHDMLNERKAKFKTKKPKRKKLPKGKNLKKPMFFDNKKAASGERPDDY